MDKDDEYIKQLQEIFNSYCLEGNSRINEEQLLKLCKSLSLNEDCANRLHHLAFPKDCHSNTTLDFDRFCDSFVAALSEVTDNDSPEQLDSPDWIEFHSPAVDSQVEVKPKLVRGGKSYGRRSVPDDIMKEENICGDEKNWNINKNEVKPDDNVAKDEEYSGDEFNYDPDVMGEPGNYFEANGLAEIIPKSGLKEKKSQSHIFSSTMMEGITDISSSSMFECENIDLFSFLNEDDAALIEVDRLVELWSQGGVDNPRAVLQTLDMTYCDEKRVIDTLRLSTALQHEVRANLISTQPSIHQSMTLALLASYKCLAIHTNAELSNYRHQVEKMKEDHERSELRHSKIIEEVDDRYLTMDQQHERKVDSIERKWARKLHATQRSFDREREVTHQQMAAEREELLKEIDSLRGDESILRRKVDVLTKENKTLSNDAVRMLERLTEAEKDAERLRKDLEYFLATKNTDDCDPVNTSQEEKFAMIIKEYEAQLRHLSDRNDEMRVEVKELHIQLRRKDTSVRYNNDDLSRERKLSSPSRRRSSGRRRRRRSDASLEDTSSSDVMDDVLSDMERSDHPRFMGSRPEQATALNYVSVRMVELEKLVEDLRRDKRNLVEDFAHEKARLKAELQEQSRSNMDAVDCRVYDDNRAVEEQSNMTRKLLEEVSQERDEWEIKYKELKESLERETSSGEQGLADLCREFATEKNELMARHETELSAVQENLVTANQKFEEEKQANQRLGEQLKFEREQHKEALAAHQEIINKFEKTATARENEVVSDKLKELKDSHVKEVELLKRDHVCALEALKHELEQKLSTILEEKQIHDNTSVCSELERLQESIGAERHEMHERMQEMREAFEREAVELRHMLDCDKAKLRRQLSEEVALIKQRIAEEGEKEMRRRRSAMEEEREKEAERKETLRREEAEIVALRSEVDSLKIRNADLERLLSDAASSLREQEEEVRRSEETKQSEGALNRRIEELRKELFERNLDNSNLRNQLNEVSKEKEKMTLSHSSLQAYCDKKEVECRHMETDKTQLLSQVRQLEEQVKQTRIDNAGLAAKCNKMERIASTPTPMVRHNASPVSRHNASSPTPMTRHNKQDEEEKLKEQIRQMAEEIDELRSKHSQHQDTPRSVQSDGDVTFELDSTVTSHSKENSSSSILRKKLSQSRKQLADYLGKMKDLYGKLSKSELLLKDLYCENAHLMRALQVTEARQRESEKRCEEEKDKNQVLGQLIKQVFEEIV